MNSAWSVAWATWRAMAETCLLWWAGICVSLVGKTLSGGCASPSLPSAVASSEWKHGQIHTPKPWFLEYEWSSNTSLKRNLSQASPQALKCWILIFAVVWQLDAVFTNISRHSMIKKSHQSSRKMHDLFSTSHTNICVVLSLRAAEWEKWSSLSSQLSQELCLYTAPPAPYGHRDNVSGQTGTQPGSHRVK